MPISRRLRFEVLRRDNYTCRYCGARAPDVTLTVDHVLPTTLGGDDDPRNLVTACHECNTGKSSIAPDQPIVEDVDATAMLFAKAVERATSIRLEQLEAEDAVLREFYDHWSEMVGSDTALMETRGWENSVLLFMARGLTMRDFERYMYAALQSRASYRQTFRYFCGCCWREISTRDEIARQLIEDGDV